MFEPPPGYSMQGGKQRDSVRDEEEDLLQFAIQQSLLEAGSEYDQVSRPLLTDPAYCTERLTMQPPGTCTVSPCMEYAPIHTTRAFALVLQNMFKVHKSPSTNNSSTSRRIDTVQKEKSDNQ